MLVPMLAAITCMVSPPTNTSGLVARFRAITRASATGVRVAVALMDDASVVPARVNHQPG
jgi:hypothetical protein